MNRKTKLLPKHSPGGQLTKAVLKKLLTETKNSGSKLRNTLKAYPKATNIGFNTLGHAAALTVGYYGIKKKFFNDRTPTDRTPIKDKEKDIAINRTPIRKDQSKPEPSIDNIINNLWTLENAKDYGLKNGKYYVYTTPNGNHDIGPGLDVDKHPELIEWAKNGRTKEELNAKAREILIEGKLATDDKLKLYSNRPDTISPQMKEGLIDTYYLVGPGEYANYNKLPEAIAKGDLPNIREESKVWFTPGKDAIISKDRETRVFPVVQKDGSVVNVLKVLDSNRYNNRNKLYYWY